MSIPIPKALLPEHPGRLLKELGEQGKRFWEGSTLFMDYALLFKPVQDALAEKDKQIQYWKDRASKKDRPERPANEEEAKAGPSETTDKGRNQEKRHMTTPGIKCFTCGERGHIGANLNCPTKRRSTQQGHEQPAATAAPSVSAVSGGTWVDTSRLSPSSREMVVAFAENRAKK
jgi:hypothetical protein